MGAKCNSLNNSSLSGAPNRNRDRSICPKIPVKQLGETERMEDREDLRSILPYLPVVSRSSSLFWPSQVVEALKALSSGPHHSRVDTGEVLFLAIADLRQSLSLAHFSDSLAFAAADGYSLFFDDVNIFSYLSSSLVFSLFSTFPFLFRRIYQLIVLGALWAINLSIYGSFCHGLFDCFILIFSCFGSFFFRVNPSSRQEEPRTNI